MPCELTHTRLLACSVGVGGVGVVAVIVIGGVVSMSVAVVVLVGLIIIVIGGLLLVVRKCVSEGRKSRSLGAVVLGPVPGVRERSGKTSDDWHALVGDGRSVSILVAHHDDSLTVDGKLVGEVTISVLEVSNLTVESGETGAVLDDLSAVVLDVGVVLINITVVVVDVDSAVSETVLERGNGLADGLSSDKHVTGLGNLELISVLTEESTVGVESINGLVKLGGSRVSWRSGLSSTVMVMSGIVVIVVSVRSVVRISMGVIGTLGIDGSSGSSEHGCGKHFHCQDSI